MIPDEEGARERFENRLEVMIAIGLGLAAILTALSVYLTDIHDDDAQVAFNTGVRSVTEATGGYVQSAQQQAADQALFAEFAQLANAGANGDGAALDAAAYLQTSIMRPELRAMVEWWGDKDRSEQFATPFVAETRFSSSRSSRPRRPGARRPRSSSQPPKRSSRPATRSSSPASSSRQHSSSSASRESPASCG